MTTQQIKAEIIKVLDTFPDTVLEDILKYLKTVKSKSHKQYKLSQDIKHILNEDQELLEKLAK
jgi:hypothetical protein